jgi:hypothetical protein
MRCRVIGDFNVTVDIVVVVVVVVVVIVVANAANF